MKFSIIIPAYNASGYIKRCLDSVTSQDFPKDEYEILVVDDCSTDNTASVIADYIADNQQITTPPDSRCNIQLIRHLNNKRQGAARNTALRAAKGEWIMFLDSDDYWLRGDVLKTFAQLILLTDTPIIESISYYTSDEPKAAHKYAPCSLEVVSADEYYQREHHPCIWTSVYSKDYIKDIQFREKVYYEDTDWKIRVYANAPVIGRTDYSFYLYYQNPDSTTKSINKQLFLDGMEANIICRECYKESKLPKHQISTILQKGNATYIKTIFSIRNYKPVVGAELLSTIIDYPIYQEIYPSLSLRDKTIVKFCKISPGAMSWLLYASVNMLRNIRGCLKQFHRRN